MSLSSATNMNLKNAQKKRLAECKGAPLPQLSQRKLDGRVAQRNLDGRVAQRNKSCGVPHQMISDNPRGASSTIEPLISAPST